MYGWINGGVFSNIVKLAKIFTNLSTLMFVLLKTKRE